MTSRTVFEREFTVSVTRGEGKWRLFVHPLATLNVEWSWQNKTLRAGVSASDEGVLLSLGLPPLALYVGVEDGVVASSLRRWGGAIVDRAVEAYAGPDDGLESVFVHWNIGTPTTRWSSDTPKWRNGGLFLAETLFGRSAHAKRVIETRPVTFHMPEGDVEATAEFYESTWTKPRWPGPWHRMYGVEVDVPKGLDDGRRKGPLFGVSMGARSIGEAVGKMLGDVLKGRGACGGATIGERVGAEGDR